LPAAIAVETSQKRGGGRHKANVMTERPLKRREQRSNRSEERKGRIGGAPGKETPRSQRAHNRKEKKKKKKWNFQFEGDVMVRFVSMKKGFETQKKKKSAQSQRGGEGERRLRPR